jgi:hypothetical protein
MAKNTKIPVLLPKGYLNINTDPGPDFVFNYLKEIGFYKYEFIDLVDWNDQNKKIFEYFVNKLAEIKIEISENVYLGALFLVNKEIPELLTYEKLCKIAVDKRGGFSATYTKIKKTNSEVMQYREQVRNWIYVVLDEPYDEMDIEVRRSEYYHHIEKIDCYAKAASNTSSEYITFLRPGSEIMQLLNNKIRGILWPDEDQ